MSDTMEMEITQSSSEGLSETFEVRLAAAEWSARMDRALSDLAGKVSVPGFRPGKVPKALLLRRYGEALREEVESSLIDESLRQLLAEREIRTLRGPKVESVSRSDEKGLVYRVVCERMPPVPAIDLGALRFEALDLDEVPKEAIESEIEALRARHRPVVEVSPARSVEEGDILTLEVEGRHEGRPLESLSGPTQVIVGRGRFPESFERGLLGLSLGEERVLPFSVPLDHPEAEVAGQEVSLRVRLSRHFAFGAVPSGDELAKLLNLPDEDGLRGRVRAQIARAAESASQEVLRRAILDDFAGRYHFDLPPSALEDEYQSILQAERASRDHGHGHDRASGHDEAHANDESPLGGSGAPGELDGADESGGGGAAEAAPLAPRREAELRGLAERRLRLGVLLSEIAHRNGIQVTAEELESAMRAEARRYSGQERETFEKLRGDPHYAQRLHGPLLEGKVFRFIERCAKIERRNVSLAELERIVEGGGEVFSSDGSRDGSQGAGSSPASGDAVPEAAKAGSSGGGGSEKSGASRKSARKG